VGAFWTLIVVRFWAAQRLGWPRAEAWTFPLLLGLLGAMALALAVSLLHLGRPFRAWRALSNLRSSWLSREVLLASLFLVTAGITAPLRFAPPGSSFWMGVADGVAALLGFALLWCMVGAYRLRTVPAWDTWITAAAFFNSAPLLGTLGTALGLALSPAPEGVASDAVGYLALGALGFQLAGTGFSFKWLMDLSEGPAEAQASADRVLDERRALLIARLALTGVSTLGCAAAIFWPAAALAGILVAFAAGLLSEVLGRFLFYEARVRVGV
jgi:anaerobic dimethyl sulfoxide reductase subunit C (anchor subunit)